MTIYKITIYRQLLEDKIQYHIYLDTWKSSHNYLKTILAMSTNLGAIYVVTLTQLVPEFVSEAT